MNEDVKSSLERLHEKQDNQTSRIGSLEISVAKQEVTLDTYARQSDRMAEELQKMNTNLATYNAELKVHIAGVIELKEQNRLMREEIKQRDLLINSRLDIAEKPILWLSGAARFAKWVAAIGSGITAIVGLILKLLGKV